MSIDTLLFMKQRTAAGRFIGFVKKILKSSRDEPIQIMYGIRGEQTLTKRHSTTFPVTRTHGRCELAMRLITRCRMTPSATSMDVIYKYYLYFPGTLDEVERSGRSSGIWYVRWKLPGISRTAVSGSSARARCICLLQSDELGSVRPGIADC